MRTGRKHPLSLLQPFRSLVRTYVKPVRRAAGKLSPAAQVEILLSYHDRSDDGVQGYRVYHWNSGRVVHRYDCDFNPELLPVMSYITKMLTTSADAQFLNRQVCKRFNDESYYGTIMQMHTGTLREHSIGQCGMHIKYSDGDREDVYFEELIKILITDASEVQKRLALQHPSLARDHAVNRPHTNEPEGTPINVHKSKSRVTEDLRRSSRRTKPTHAKPALDSTARYDNPPRGTVMHAKQIGAGRHPDDMVPEMVIDFKITIARDLPQPKSYKSVVRAP